MWEMVFRCRHADIEQPEAKLEDKAAWLKAEEGDKKLHWGTTIRPRVDSFFTDPEAVNTHFNAAWKRLCEVAHPSMNWMEAVAGDSCRIMLDSFDERFARQTLADLCDVLALVWVVFVNAFPKIGPRLAADPNLFRHTPQVRLCLPIVPVPVGASG